MQRLLSKKSWLPHEQVKERILAINSALAGLVNQENVTTFADRLSGGTYGSKLQP
jgi:hypothetical protein